MNAFYQLKIKIFNHPGIDAKGILRATFNNIKNLSQNKRLEELLQLQQVAKIFIDK